MAKYWVREQRFMLLAGESEPRLISGSVSNPVLVDLHPSVKVSKDSTLIPHEGERPVEVLKPAYAEPARREVAPVPAEVKAESQPDAPAPKKGGWRRRAPAQQ